MRKTLSMLILSALIFSLFSCNDVKGNEDDLEASRTGSEISMPEYEQMPEPIFDLEEYMPYGTEGATKVVIKLEDLGEKLPDELFYGNTYITDIYIEDGITELGFCCFKNCPSLKTVRLPLTLKTLRTDKSGMFESCTSLERIYIPDGIDVIPYCCFSGCTALKQIRLPETLISIERDAFANTAMGSIKLPNSLKSLGSVPPNVEIIELSDTIEVFNTDMRRFKAVFVTENSITHDTLKREELLSLLNVIYK